MNLDSIYEKLEQLYNSSEFNQGNLYLEKIFDERPKISREDTLKLTLYQIRFWIKLDKLDQAAHLTQIYLKDDFISKNEFYQLQFMLENAKVQFLKGKLEILKINLKEIEEIMIYHDIFEDPRYFGIIGDFAIMQGGYEWKQGNLASALYYFKIDYKTRLKEGKQLSIANALNNIGVLYNAKGDFHQALKYLNKSLRIYEKIHFRRGTTKTGHNIAAILLQQGELEKSKELMLKYLAIDEKDNYIEGMAVAYQNLGEIYWHQNDFINAIHYYTKGYRICRGMGNELAVSVILVPYIIALLEVNYMSLASIMLNKLEEIAKNSNNQLLIQRHLLARALVLKAKKTPEMDSIIIADLKTIADSEIRYFDTTVMAISYLCEILINKAQETQNLKILELVDQYLDKLLDFASKSNSFYILAKIYWIQAELQLYRMQFTLAQKNFMNSFHIIIRYNLKMLEQKLLNRYDNFLQNWSFWNQSHGKNIDRQKKQQLKQIRFQIKSLIIREIEEKTERVEEEIPIFIKIMEPTGKSIYKMEFKQIWDKDSLVYRAFQISFYEAFSDFIKNGMNIAQFGDYRIMFIRYRLLVIAYVYRGPSYFAYQKIDSFTDILTAKQGKFEKIKHKLSDKFQQEKNQQNSDGFNHQILNFITALTESFK